MHSNTSSPSSSGSSTSNTVSSIGMGGSSQDDSQLKYPTRRSFVVDMNNRPLYECDRRPGPESLQKTRASLLPKVLDASMPPSRPSAGSETTDGNVVYYPLKSPYRSRRRTTEKGGKCTTNMWIMICMFFLLVVILALNGVLLFKVLEVHHDVSEILIMANQTMEDVKSPDK